MGVRNLVVTLTGDTSDLSRALRSAGVQVEAFAHTVDKSGKTSAAGFTNVQKAVALGVVAIATGLTATAVAAAQFDQRMRNVNSLTHDSETQLRATGQAVLDLSRGLPQSANTLAEGLYDIASSGFSGAKGLEVLEASAEAASAGLTTTATAAQAITAVLNAYGLSAASATDVSDTLFQTVNLGVINFEQLSGVIGDVVGTAAAAGVSIDQIGSAIATMTLTGISGAEAGTSLNRVLQSLIQPSDALRSTYARLGIENGATALKTEGLRAVLEQLRTATGGNITSLLELFPEIRAARGALALMSDDGRTYARVSGQIENANRRQGATHRALKEQLKAASAQFTIYKNDAKATAIELGLSLLPAFITLLRETHELGGEAMPKVQAGFAAAGPLFHALASIGADVATVLGTILSVAGPLAGALLAIGGGAVIGTLTALATALASVTGFLADNKTIVLALAAGYAATLLPSLAAVRIAFNRLILSNIVVGLAAILTGADGAAVALRGMAASLLSVQAVATAGFAIAIFAAARGFSQLQESQHEARAETDKIRQSFNALDFSAAQRSLATLRGTVLQALAASKDYNGVLGTLRAGIDEAFGKGRAGDIAFAGKEAANAYADLSAKLAHTKTNLAAVSAETGVAIPQLAKLAIAQNIDLSDAPGRAKPAIAQLISYVHDLEKQTGVSAANMANDVGMDIDKMQAFADAIQQAKDKAAQAFASSTDIVSNFDPSKGLDELKSATQRVHDAEQHLADLRDQQRGKDKLTISDTQALRQAREDVASATTARTEAAAARSTATVEGFYRQTIAVADRFTRQLHEVTARGLDPSVVTRLLEAGPEKAAPLLQRLVSDHSGRLIQLVNTSERKLRAINQTVVEQARLTAIAVNSTTDQNARDLGRAMDIAQAEIQAHGRATAEAIAKSLKIPPREVLRIARNFGITLAGAAQAGADAHPIHLAVAPSGKLAQLDRAGVARAAGGTVPGPWLGPTADNVVIRANPREFVQPVASVDYYGVDFMERVRTRRLPRFADGGLVGLPAATSTGSSTTVLRVPVSEITHHEQPVIIEHAQLDGWADIQRRADRARRARSTAGYQGPQHGY